LVFGDIKSSEAARLRQLTQSTPMLRVVQVTKPGMPATAREHVIDHLGHVRSACQAQDKRWALLRPDSYLAATGVGIDGDLVHRLSQALTLI
jgi:3-(3-hydroxy-phenyl)propionate hydroxylase